MLRLIKLRWAYAAVAAACLGLVAFALYLQHVYDLEPCPLCILQRIAFMATGLFALLGIVFRSAALSRWLPVVVALPIVAGLITAARHVWLEHFPPKALGCGAGLEHMIQNTPLAELLPAIFRGTGDCSIVLWRFLGLSIAEWSFICLTALLVVTVLIFTRAVKLKYVQ